MKKLLLTLTTTISFLVAATAAHAATILVHPGNLDGWQRHVDPTGAVIFVGGPAIPPLGVGSAQLSVGTGSFGGDNGARLRNHRFNFTRLSNLRALSYSTYPIAWNVPGPTGGQAPYIILHVDYDEDGADDDLLFFEPAYQNGSFNPALPDQGEVTLNRWQSWNALVGGWWSLNGTAGATPGAGVKPLSAIIAAEPTARIVNVPAGGGVRVNVGFANPTDRFVGSVDAFRIANLARDETSNFDPTTRCRGVVTNQAGRLVDDVLTGTPARDVVALFKGNDTFRGLRGNDLVCGGQGSDRLFGNRGKDVIAGNVGGDLLRGGPARDRLLGGAARDRLFGGSAFDILKGGGGSDFLRGGGGRDRLRGGAGRDRVRQ